MCITSFENIINNGNSLSTIAFTTPHLLFIFLKASCVVLTQNVVLIDCAIMTPTVGITFAHALKCPSNTVFCASTTSLVLLQHENCVFSFQ